MQQTAWNAIAVAVLALPQHGKLHVPRGDVPHPQEAGLYRSIGLARKCRHYRHAMPDGRGLHVHEYADHYRVHWDAVDPSVSLLKHFLHDVMHVLARPIGPERLSKIPLSSTGSPAPQIQQPQP